MAASPDSLVDVMMGIGGVPEGILAACATRAMGGGMLGRLAPHSAEEREAVRAAGLDTRQILACGELVSCISEEDGTEIARGLSNYSAAEASKIAGFASGQFESILGYIAEPELIHRDNLALL